MRSLLLAPILAGVLAYGWPFMAPVRVVAFTPAGSSPTAAPYPIEGYRIRKEAPLPHFTPRPSASPKETTTK